MEEFYLKLLSAALAAVLKQPVKVAANEEIEAEGFYSLCQELLIGKIMFRDDELPVEREPKAASSEFVSIEDLLEFDSTFPEHDPFTMYPKTNHWKTKEVCENCGGQKQHQLSSKQLWNRSLTTSDAYDVVGSAWRSTLEKGMDPSSVFRRRKNLTSRSNQEQNQTSCFCIEPHQVTNVSHNCPNSCEYGHPSALLAASSTSNTSISRQLSTPVMEEISNSVLQIWIILRENGGFWMSENQNTTIRDIKENIRRDYGIPCNRQRLTYSDNKLEDYQTLEACKIQDGCVISLEFLPRGRNEDLCISSRIFDENCIMNMTNDLDQDERSNGTRRKDDDEYNSFMCFPLDLKGKFNENYWYGEGSKENSIGKGEWNERFLAMSRIRSELMVEGKRVIMNKKGKKYKEVIFTTMDFNIAKDQGVEFLVNGRKYIALVKCRINPINSDEVHISSGKRLLEYFMSSIEDVRPCRIFIGQKGS